MPRPESIEAAREWVESEWPIIDTTASRRAEVATSLAALIEAREDAAREAEQRRCIGIVEYSVDNVPNMMKTVARICEGHEQHTNRARGKEGKP